MNKETNTKPGNGRYGLVGEKLGHSFSPMLHAMFGDYEYGLIEVPADTIDDFFKKADFACVNVTIPYKEKAMAYCMVDAGAKAIGCVNTLVNHGTHVSGYNTDTFGFEYMIKRAGIDVAGKKAAILGSGGTSRTAAYTLSRLGAASVAIVSRHPSDMGIKADCPVKYLSYSDAFDDCEILVNTTPVGMYPRIEGKPVDISNGYVNLEAVVDVIYNPLRTRLVYAAGRRGIRCTGGLPMLVAQGFFAARLFMGRDIGPDPVGSLTDADEQKIEEAISSITAMNENIVLTGMPGSGKSSVGRSVSKFTGFSYVDTDELFSEQNGMTPSKCISTEGEAAFRALEKKAVAAAAASFGAVIATGGGVVLDPENIELLSLNGKIIYLSRKLSELATTDRPLSAGAENLKALYYKRLPIYLRNCDAVVTVSGSVNSVAEEVLARMRKERNMKILVINGPNLNMLGIREPDIYGRETYEDLLRLCRDKAKQLGIDVDFYQSNHEGDLVDAIQQAYGVASGIVINPGGYTHTSVAILDALKAVGIPAIEVHISAVDTREDFRQISYVRSYAAKVIMGHGLKGYTEAMEELYSMIRSSGK